MHGTFLVIFQVFHDFQCLWEPYLSEQLVMKWPLSLHRGQNHGRKLKSWWHLTQSTLAFAAQAALKNTLL